MELLSILLQAKGAEQGNPLTSFLPLILIIAVFWLFMIRPQMKKQKDLQKYRQSLDKGDKVITTGGIYGKIESISEKYVSIDCGNNVKLRVDKNAILKDSSDLQEKK